MFYKCNSCGKEVEALKAPETCKGCNGTSFNSYPSSSFSRGEVIAGFKLINRIGFGGMGEVWLAEQISMSRLVALKILHPDFSRNANFTNRFLNEIKHSAKLDHPNIVTAFDAGVYEGIYYLASAYIKGKQLQQKINEEKIITEKESLNIALGIAKALNYAWGEFNILHRDIKPGNIIIDLSGTPKLLDMGVAKSITEEKSITIDGDVVGTPHYISPEQAKSENIDFRADIYSLGATLYHMITGALPFEGPNAMSVLAKHITDELTQPIEKNPNISPALNNLIFKMMEKKKENRHQHWEEVIFNIEGILNGRLSNEKVTVKKPSLQQKKISLAENSSSIPKEFLTRVINVSGQETLSCNIKPSLVPEQIPIDKITKSEQQSEPAEKRKKKERLLLKSSIGLLLAITFILFVILAGVYEDSLRNNPVMAFAYDSYDKLQILANLTLSAAFQTLTGQEVKFNSSYQLKLSWIFSSFIFSAFILGSAFCSAAIAEKYLKKLRIPCFMGGLFVPWLFPLLLKIRLAKMFFVEPTQKLKSSEVFSHNDKGSYKYKLFKKISKNDDGSLNGPFVFELTNDSILNVQKISEVKKDLLVLEIVSDNGILKTVRIPFSNIKTFSTVN